MTPTQMRLAAERKARLERMQQASLQHFDRCYDEAQIFIPAPEPPPAAEPEPFVELLDEPSSTRVPLNVTKIQLAVCEHFGVNREMVRSKCRRRMVSRPRHIAMLLVREFCPHMSFGTIGLHFGGHDNSTVVHAIREIKKKLRVDPAVARSVKELRGKLSHLRGWA